MVFSFIIINQITPSDVDVLEVSIFKVQPVPPVKRNPQIVAPPVAPTPTPNFQIEPQSTSAQTRTVTTRQVRSTSVSAPKAAAVASPVSQPSDTICPPRNFCPRCASRANDQSAQSLATAVDLPIQSDAPLAAGLSEGNSSLSGYWQYWRRRW